MEIKYNKKIDNYKKRMLEFLKKNEKERFQFGTQAELNNKLNILHIQELINELEIQGVEVEDLLKERQELKMRIMELNHDLFIYQEVIDTLTKKNYKFENKIKKISSKIEEYNLIKNKKLNQILTEPNETSINIKTLNKLGKARNLRNLSTNNNKDILKSVENKYSSSVSSKKSFLSYSNKNNKIKISMPINKVIKININNDKINKKEEYKDKNKDKNNQNNYEALFKEKEKYKDFFHFYKDKFEIIKNKYTNIFNIYNKILEKYIMKNLLKIIKKI